MNKSACEYTPQSKLDGCIFGWVLFKEIDLPIAHHAGIIVKWIPEDPWKSIVAHYGSDCTSRVLVETLKDAVIRSDVKIVRINPYYHAQFEEPPYMVDQNGNIHPTSYILSFENEHPQYNVITSNCQHFVQRFVGDIPVESDVFSHITPICQNLLHTMVFGKQKDIDKVLENVANSYYNHRQEGICAWDPCLDLDVPEFR